jgi:beta-N-acetylhexosaminidase
MTDALARAAAGCLLPSFRGTVAPDWVLRLAESGVGGFVLFATNVRDGEQVRLLTKRLRAAGERPLVALDEEGGDVTRLFAHEGSPYPGALALGRVDDVGLTRRIGAAIARELRAVGVDLNLAPVADVSSNPRNPVIGARAFGSTPDHVARHVEAFVSGHQEAGVAACVKHFPGHGDVALDSHLQLPTSDLDAEALEAGPLVPFRAALDAGARAVMTAHVLLPAVDDAPATLSARILGGLLRQRLGFQGTIVSDALDMRAISAGIGVEEGAVQSLAAGADALCLGPEIDEAGIERVRQAIVAAVHAGRLDEARVREAAAHVRATTRNLPAVGGAPDRALGRRVAASALLVEGDAPSLHAPVTVVDLRPAWNIAAGPSPFTLSDALGSRLGTVRSIVLDADGAAPEVPSGEGSLVVVLRDAGRFEWQQARCAALVAAQPDAVVVETGVPGWRPDAAATFVTTFGAGRASLEAAAEALASASVGGAA